MQHTAIGVPIINVPLRRAIHTLDYPITKPILACHHKSASHEIVVIVHKSNVMSMPTTIMPCITTCTP